MKILKKNQLAILVIALMLVTAGYLNYISKDSVETGVEAGSSDQYAAIITKPWICQQNQMRVQELI